MLERRFFFITQQTNQIIYPVQVKWSYGELIDEWRMDKSAPARLGMVQ